MMPDLPNVLSSLYQALYNLLIPVDNELRLIHDFVPFGFITKLLADTYCHDNERMAVHPVRMFTYLFPKTYSNLFDVDLVRQAKTDLTYKYFLDLSSEYDVINHSSFTKFRRTSGDIWWALGVGYCRIRTRTGEGMCRNLHRMQKLILHRTTDG